MSVGAAIANLLLLASSAGSAANEFSNEPFDAQPAEYTAMTPAENFGKAIIEACPLIIEDKVPLELSGDSNLAVVQSLPSYLANYPTNKWYAFKKSPRNVFVSADGYDGPRRCRVILANNMNSSSANLFLAGELQKQGAQSVEFMSFNQKTKLNESVLYRDMGDHFVVYLIQNMPVVWNGGKGQQAMATTMKMSREQISKFFKGIK